MDSLRIRCQLYLYNITTLRYIAENKEVPPETLLQTIVQMNQNYWKEISIFNEM